MGSLFIFEKKYFIWHIYDNSEVLSEFLLLSFVHRSFNVSFFTQFLIPQRNSIDIKRMLDPRFLNNFPLSFIIFNWSF